MVDPARLAAYDALVAVETRAAYLNLALPARLGSLAVTGRAAAFATSLANGTVRMQGSYDAVLDTCVAPGARPLQPGVRVALRLGCHQLLAMAVAPHAAVSTTVELVRERAGERPVRLVNAVLRRVAERGLDDWMQLVAPARGDDPAGHLAVRYSHPRWAVDAFATVLGGARALGDGGPVEQLLVADNEPAEVALAVRPGLASAAEVLAADGGARLTSGRWSPYALRLDHGDPRDIKAVRSSLVGVQDEGSQLAALALAAAGLGAGPDSRWVDLCAGPGGKSALLNGLARQRGAALVAVERREHRARLVQAALRGYRHRLVVVADGRAPPLPDGWADRVLVDAPCTGLGALRRRPDARWRHRVSDLPGLVALQRALLGAALRLVRPGGTVAYVTCSPHLAETREVVDAVVGERVGVAEEDARALLLGVPDLGPGPAAQLWPHLHGTDAMFISILRARA